MFKHKWIYILLILSVSICSVSLYMRHEAEQQFHQVEMAIPYYDLVTARDGNDEALNRLLASGATTIVLRQSTIEELQQREIVRYYAADEAPPEFSLITRQANQSFLLLEPMKTEEHAYYVSWLKSVFKDNIEFDKTENGQVMAIINVPATQLGSLPLGIDVRLAEAILARYSAELVPLYINHSLYSDQAFMEQQLQSLKDLQIDHLYFGGNEVLGYPQRLSEVAHLLTLYDMHFTLIRSQLGAKQLAQWMDYELLRVIFVEPNKLVALSPAEAADLYELSVRERTVSMIYYPFPKDISIPGQYEQYVEQIDASMKETITRLSPDYQLTKAVPLSDLVGDRDGKELYTISAFIGILLLAILFKRRFVLNNWMTGIVVAVSAMTMGLWYVSDSYAELIQSGYGLLGAIVAPTLAIIIGQEAAEWIRVRARNEHKAGWLLLYACLLYAMVAIVTLSGIVLVVSLFDDISYLSYVDQFRGVKFMLMGPIILTLVYIWRRGDIRTFTAYVYRIAVTDRNRKKLILLIVLFGCVGVIGVYFVLRAGNEGTLLPFEAEFRHWMDSFFGVRPRTKEIWIGHPLLLLALYAWLRYGKGRWLLLAGVIGQLSMMNTFSHLHSPLVISLTRTLLGLTIGLFIGMLLIIVLRSISYIRNR